MNEKKRIITWLAAACCYDAYTMTAGPSENKIADAIKVIHSEDKPDKT